MFRHLITKRLLLPALLPLLLASAAVRADPEAGEEGLPPAPPQAVAAPAKGAKAPGAKGVPAPPKPVLVPVVRSQYAILVDAVTGKLLWQRNPDARRPIASTTKMLTAILLLERGHLDDIVTAPNGVQYLPDSSLHLKPGEKISLRDLLYALLLRSANDTAVAGAVYLDGSVPKFARDMNAKAREIGATHSHFVTPNGLPAPGHYSTAADLAKIACYAINRLPQFSAIVRTPAYKVRRSKDTRDVWVKNTARTFLLKFPGADGVKTGYIRAAGHCFVGSATRRGWRLVAVALDSGTCREDVESLLNYGFADFGPHTVVNKGDAVGSVDVPAAAGPVKVVSARSLFLVDSLRRPASHWTLRVTPLAPTPPAPIRAGTRLGTVTVLVDGRPQASGDVVAADDVPARPLSALARTGRTVGPTLAILGGLAALALLALGGVFLYGRATAKDAGGGGGRVAPGLRGVDRPGPRPR